MSSEIQDRKNIAETVISQNWNGQNSVFENFANLGRILISNILDLNSFNAKDGKYDLNYTPTPASCVIAGRIIYLRALGKIIFLRLRDGSGEIQVQFSPQHLSNFQELQISNYLSVGDFISTSGSLIVSKTGELTLAAKSFQLLTKAYRPLPTKSNISDQEILYRQRYLDFTLHPEKLNLLRLRALTLKTLRSILDENGFIEVETPTLHHSVGGASARPFVTHHNFLDQDLTLRVAPELYLKRLLVGGLEKVYEIGRCYRNEAIDSKHNPEFTSLEFYWSYTSLSDMINFVHAMLASLICFDNCSFNVGEKPFIISIEDLASKWCEENCEMTLEEWHIATECLGNIPAFEYFFEKCKNLSKEMKNLFLFENFVEKTLAEKYNAPVFITGFPIEASPLAKKDPNNPKLADRFELYINGIEVANGFQELNDPDLQAQNFQQQLEAKKNPDAEYMDFDSDYITALEYGMPPAVGCGIGIDRLVMLLAGQKSLKEVLAFPATKKI